MSTLWVPSAMLSSTASIGKSTEAAPAGTTTCAGATASVVSLLVKVTVSGAEKSVSLRVTVPVAAAAPAFSANVVGAMDRLNTVGTVRSSSSSSTSGRIVWPLLNAAFPKNVRLPRCNLFMTTSPLVGVNRDIASASGMETGPSGAT